MKGNVIQLNTLHLNSVRLNGIGKVQSVSLKGGSTEDPVFPPVEPPVEPTPTYTLSASVTNGKVSAKRNGSAVNLPYTANEGDTIIVEVTPNDGYTFEGWADGNTDNPRSITMTADVALSAQCVEVVVPSKYIQFEDKAVEAICVENWSSDGIGLTEEDAAKVTSLNGKFSKNKDIVSFEEFQYFTGVTEVSGNLSWGGDFYTCTSLKKIKFPSSITSIQALAFYGCSELTTADIPESVTYIGQQAFFGCNKLTSKLYLPNLISLGIRAFRNCHTLGDIENLGAITAIQGDNGGGTFESCRTAKMIRIPASVTTIGAYALYGCSSLEKIICEATTPPSLANATTLTSTNNCPIYVPDASLEAYKTATNWVNYADRIHPLSEIEGSPYITFADAEVERVLMAKGVSSDGIGITKEDAAAVTNINTWYRGNTAITSFEELKYFTKVTTLTNAFTGCTSLASVNFDNIEATSRGGSGNGCCYKTALTKVIMPNIVDLGDWTFRNSTTETAFIGKNCTIIGSWAFIGTPLATLVCAATTVPTLNNTNAIPSGCVIYVPDESLTAYQGRQNWSSFATKIKGISQLATDNPTLYAEIQQYF